MKRVFTAVVALGVGVAWGRLFGGVLPRAETGAGQGGGAEKCAAKNGDVNADGNVDLSDAVTILGNLFLGNPTQLPMLCAVATAGGSLPDTGQTKCYDASGAEIPCDSAACPGQDGFYATGCPSEGRFVDNDDGTVTDNCTGLMWQKDTADVNGDGQRDSTDAVPWCKALDYCKNLELGGNDDWRLPNVRELGSISNFGHGNPVGNDQVFAEAEFSKTGYWSSTNGIGAFVAAPDTALFGIAGETDFVDKDSSLAVRAVRTGPCASKNGDINADGTVDLSDAVTVLGNLFLGNPTKFVPLCRAGHSFGLPDSGQTSVMCWDRTGAALTCDSPTCAGQDGSYATGCPTEGRFTDNGDGTVTDNCTGLIWQKDTADLNGDGRLDRNDAVPWCRALQYCENLSFGGHNDWRLPNRHELESIVDFGRRDPAADQILSALSEGYWSSTSVVRLPIADPMGTLAVAVSFAIGSVSTDLKPNRYYVRAVRSGP